MSDTAPTSGYDSFASSPPSGTTVNSCSWHGSDWTAFLPTVPSHSERFWFEDGTAVLQVEKTLYKLYKGVLTRQSEFFKKNLTSRAGYFTPRRKEKPMRRDAPCLVGNGSEDRPLVLQVKEAEFELLLSYMFPEDYTFEYRSTLREWVAIANVSKSLSLDSVREAAIYNILKTADALELIDIGVESHSSECYLEGFRQLCLRDAPLSLEEGKRLGLATVIAIAHARDMRAKGSECCHFVKEEKDLFPHCLADATGGQLFRVLNIVPAKIEQVACP